MTDKRMFNISSFCRQSKNLPISSHRRHWKRKEVKLNSAAVVDLYGNLQLCMQEILFPITLTIRTLIISFQFLRLFPVILLLLKKFQCITLHFLQIYKVDVDVSSLSLFLIYVVHKKRYYHYTYFILLRSMSFSIDIW